MKAHPTSQRPFLFFQGFDMAPAQGVRSDNASMVTLRAQPRFDLDPNAEEERTRLPADFDLAFVNARRLRNLSTREHSGLLHRDHDRYQFARLCLDPNGGGNLVARDLAERQQLINGIEVDRIPLLHGNEERVAVGLQKVILFKRGDPEIEQLWPGLSGDDMLVSYAHIEFKNILDMHGIRFPALRTKDETVGWPKEKVDALHALSDSEHGVIGELKNVVAATREDGTYVVTARGGYKFESIGKKDMAYAALYAYVAFLCWLKSGEVELETAGGRQGGMLMSFND